MRNYRFTISQQDKILNSQLEIYNPELIHQIKNVLRLKPGAIESISFIDGSKLVRQVSLVSLENDCVKFHIEDSFESKKELKTDVCFYIPLIKNEAMAFMLRKLCELGVQQLQPVIFSRVQKQNLDSFLKQKKRYLKIIQEATEQCEGAVFTELFDPIKFSELNQVKGLSIFASERMAHEEISFDHKLALMSELESKKICSLLVGPEGGLTDEEVAVLQALKFQACSLGRRLLKAETAAITLFSSLNIN